MWLCHHGSALTAEPCPKGWDRSAHDPRSLEPPADAATGAQAAPQLQSLQLAITQAPAEFTLPVKQDRQFMPPFRVEVRCAALRCACAAPCCSAALRFDAVRTTRCGVCRRAGRRRSACLMSS